MEVKTPSADTLDLALWEPRFRAFPYPGGDAAHDGEHVRRVVTNAQRLARQEGADIAIVLPAAYLHDCVSVPKDSPQRSRASRLAADAAVRYLSDAGYPALCLPAVHHAIEAHSFTANVAPQTREAQIVQDADRLDALGAIGLARCLMLGGALGRPLYDPDEPFPVTRAPDDSRSNIDHFYTKLLHLSSLMNTDAGRAEAERRTAFLYAFLEQLGSELSS